MDRANQHTAIPVQGALEDNEADIPAPEDLEEDLSTVEEITDD